MVSGSFFLLLLLTFLNDIVYILAHLKENISCYTENTDFFFSFGMVVWKRKNVCGM